MAARITMPCGTVGYFTPVAIWMIIAAIMTRIAAISARTGSDRLMRSVIGVTASSCVAGAGRVGLSWI